VLLKKLSPKVENLKIQNSPAVAIAMAHIDAWGNHDWDKTKELLAPNIHAVVTTTQPELGEFNGIDDYMAIKVKAARLIEPGSVEVLSAIGDESHALVMVTFRIGMGPGGSMVTMARTGLYLLDENKKIKEERDSFFIVS
jgi:SnoaL-like domain